LRERIGDIRARGADVVVVGNGGPHFAAAFREDLRLDCPLLVDPELRAYRAAGLRRGRAEMLSPRLALHAWRALRGGHRQAGVQGDPWQLGGVLVIRPDGTLTYRHVSREAGDHPPVEAMLAALAPGAPAIAEPEPPRSGREWLGRALGALVDPTIVLSFSRTGFAIHGLAFRTGDLDVDLSGRRCLVTGANSGIGFETALGLADLGAEVGLLCRSRERGEAAVARIREVTGNPRVWLEVLDVSSLAAVRKVAARLNGERVDVLVHNAGTLPDRRIETAEGFELALATHVVGPHLLTGLLRPALERSPDARVVWVSSGGMYTRRLTVSDPNWTRRPYDGVLAYAETKRAQVVLAELWAEVFRGTSVVVNAMHPGWADTPSVRTSLPVFHRVTRAILRTPAEGADTVVWLAAAPSAHEWTGRFFLDRTPRRTHLLPFTRETAEERRALWQHCEAWSGARASSGGETT
jgi:dehydrogenase/reductase SDR family protein 12